MSAAFDGGDGRGTPSPRVGLKRFLRREFQLNVRASDFEEVSSSHHNVELAYVDNGDVKARATFERESRGWSLEAFDTCGELVK